LTETVISAVFEVSNALAAGFLISWTLHQPSLKPPPALWHNRAILRDWEISLEGNVRELERLTAGIAGFCAANALDSDVEFDLNLVLEELFSNSLRHGGCEGMPDAAHVRLSLTADGVALEYSDRGAAFNPLDAPEPDLARPLTERSAGGLGVHLVRRVVQDLRYRRRGESNQITMTRRMQTT
jgi:anti-sigma regulatory factor (Ser/Thr protein kinase)